MLKLYTDDSPGLRVYVYSIRIYDLNVDVRRASFNLNLIFVSLCTATLSSSSFSRCPSSRPSSSCIYPPRLSRHSPSNRPPPPSPGEPHSTRASSNWEYAIPFPPLLDRSFHQKDGVAIPALVPVPVFALIIMYCRSFTVLINLISETNGGRSLSGREGQLCV